MKEKIINYIETLEAKSLQVDDYFKQRNELYISNQEKDKEIERLNNIINELEKDLIEYFKKEYPDRKLEDYNLENCTYDYALVILGRLQELKGSNKE